MKKVCLDTNILVWGVKETANAGQEINIPRAKFLFEYFDAKKITVVIPSLVLGELLSNVTDVDEAERIFDYISANFEILQHDVLSARVFARKRIQLDAKNIKQYLQENHVPKCRMINDLNICSMAIASECDGIFTNNLRDFQKFMDGEIPIYDIEHSDVLKAQLEAENLASPKSKQDTGQGNLFEGGFGLGNTDDDDDEPTEIKLNIPL